MNAVNTVRTVFGLLDETKRGIVPYELAVEAVNRAQREVLHDLHRVGDERGLRPLTTLTANLTTGDTVDDVLFVRCGLWYPSGTATLFQGLLAHYVEYDKFMQHENMPVPNHAPMYYMVYTYVNGVVLFPNRTGDERLRLCYVRNPADFVCVTNGASPITQAPLELPEEYHFTVCQRAATLLNDLDVEEQGRDGIANL